VRRHVPHTAALAGAVIALAGCTGGMELDPMPTSDPPPPRAIATVEAPPEDPALVASQDPAELALRTSETYFASAQTVILAPVDDPAATARAASIAVAAGAPVLLTGDPGGGAALEAELIRLSTGSVVTVGAVSLEEFDDTGLTIAPAPQDVDELGELLELDLQALPGPDQDSEDPDETDTADGAESDEDADADEGDESGDGESGDDGATDEGAADPGYVQMLADLEPGQVLDVEPADSETPDAEGELRQTLPTERLSDQTLIADGHPAQAGAVGTARAAGAQVVVGSDLAGSPELIDQLEGAQNIIGLGEELGDEDTFAWQALTAATGVQLPGGGQHVFGDKRYIALYGHPRTPAMGVLGEQGTEETIEVAEDYAEPYRDLTDEQVVPALEIIVTVATGAEGEEGNYTQAWPAETFEPLIEAAQEAGQYVVLDFQPGRQHFLDQIRQYEDLLAYPHVGVALDPEWRLGPDQQHLNQIGQVDAEEINEVSAYLADFVVEHNLPQKMLVLHQFQQRMILDREDVNTSRPQVPILIHADGQGSQSAKQDTWDNVRQDAPEAARWGWKNFIDEDTPMLTPEETYEVEPLPEFVSYQ